MRGANLVKLLRAIDLLSRPSGATVAELSERLEIDKRSVYRLLNTLEELGFPLTSEKEPLGRKKRWFFIDEFQKRLPNLTVPDVRFSLSEIISLYLLKKGEAAFRGTDIEKRIDSAFKKIEMFVPEGLFPQLEKVRTLFVAPSKFSKDYSDKQQVIEDLCSAMLQGRVCLVTYHAFSDDRVKGFRIAPLYFFENNGGLYCFVNICRFDEIRILAVERIKALEVTGESFDYPEDFDPERFLDTTFGIIYDEEFTVRIWFSREQARYIRERSWARRQKITEEPDGSIILEMVTSGWYDVKRWVMTYGPEARLLEPEGLREEIRRDLKKMLEAYEK